MNSRDWCEVRFLTLWEGIRADYQVAGIKLFEQLAARYQEPHRHYHTLEHIRYCLEVFDRFKTLTQHPGSIEIAIFYHDAINDVTQNAHNEERSVAFSEEFFYRAFYGTRQDAWDLNKQLILATKHDRLVTDPDEQLIVDIDLSALGAPWPIFLQNNQNVRKEYGHVSEDKFREGNGKILQQFLNRTPLYYHPEIEKAFGTQAKENLTHWLARP